MEFINTLIVGSSAAGLSCAAQLSKKGIDYKLIEKHSHVANAWRNHYERLHLHTNKSASHLPYVKFPKKTPKYPSKLQVIEYLENYSSLLKIEPYFNTTVTKIIKGQENWITQTNTKSFTSKNVIVCTGNTNVPKKYSKPGIKGFPGKILHSSEYKNGVEFENEKVLVVGFGNSACEIALCLYEHGATTSLSVRSPVNVIPRDILGVPVLQLGILLSKLTPKMADKLNAPLLRLFVGNITKYGLEKLPYGPTEQIVKHHKIPLIDIGTMNLIKKGEINILGDVVNINKDKIEFENGIIERFDSIITAIGYESGLSGIIDIDSSRKEDIRINARNRKYFGKDGIYFCGFYVAPTGMLREINIESRLIANKIKIENDKHVL